VAVNRVTKGRTGYAASRRHCLVGSRNAEISHSGNCHPESRPEAEGDAWQCKGIDGVSGVDERGAGHADGAGACIGQPQACVSA